MKRGHQLHTDQAAFVSIFSVLIIMGILALVMIGFSSITRRSQKATLDNQLNTQAFYAAESGVNDARAALALDPTLTKNVCQGSVGGFSYNNNLDAASNTGYTCVLISAASDFKFDSIPEEGKGNPKVFPFGGSTAIATFNVTLQSATGSMTVPSSTTFVPQTSRAATDLGILRVDMVPNTFDRAAMIAGGYTFYVFFSTGGASGTQTVSNSTAGQGSVVLARCAAGSTSCTTTIRLAPGTETRYTMRLQSIYQPVKATIDTIKNAGGGSVDITAGQSVVDVTGKANDVFRRIQVRLPVFVNGLTPSFVIQSGDSICKRLQATPADTSPNLADPACAIN